MKNSPHKFADVIKAWADGQDVQYQYQDDEWYDYPHGFQYSPDFCDSGGTGITWRIKPGPVILKYRRFISGKNTKPYVDTFVEHLGTAGGIEDSLGFIRWIDIDWQEQVL